ncbi:MAG: phosphomannomutase [Gammaproteobacteria bacterium]|nr:phosphomannomutase [Gammaproteobacteria bacterium]
MTTSIDFPPDSLAQSLAYAPRELAFGTSGRRGLVADLSQLEVYLNARAELDYLLALPRAKGGIVAGDSFYLAHDLRPSSVAPVAVAGGRGGLAQAIHRAVSDAGLRAVNLGAIPTPALAAYALARGAGSMMVTGSHIPFDRNGYKTNTAIGELMKTDEAPIAARVAAWRDALMRQPASVSAFDARGMLRGAGPDLPRVNPAGAREYRQRYADFFGSAALAGLRVLVYQHSAVGRELLVETLEALGAEVTPTGRSEIFVPIDTEAIDESTLAGLQALAEAQSRAGHRFDALVSTDGDSDRPLLVGLEYGSDGAVSARFFGGDLVGMVVAESLEADAVVVPISCNDAITRGRLAAVLEPRTRIGSPYVIAGMLEARGRGCQRVCGWEANGGFLTATDFLHGDRLLPALPTRDAFLPLFSVLAQMKSRGLRMAELFEALPRRYSRAGLLRDFPRARSLQILAACAEGKEPSPSIESFFSADCGFGALVGRDYTDGLRLQFSNGDVAHLRPSGNAEELRLYAVADSQARADEIIRLGLAEPDGILHRLARAFG